MSDLIKISRYISLLLRHKPELAGITLDMHGWADVNEIITAVCNHYQQPFSMIELEAIVANDNKCRYTFNEEKTLIRANQGHSVDVDVELKKAVPPDILWHGTADKFVKSIDEQGLAPQNRLYVHLSSDVETALSVGKRHGVPVIYMVDCASMLADGHEFFISRNKVWLTKSVPAKYLNKNQKIE